MSQKKIKAERKLKRMNGEPVEKKHSIKITPWNEYQKNVQELKKHRKPREVTGWKVFGKKSQVIEETQKSIEQSELENVKDLIENSIDLDPEFNDIVNDNFNALTVKVTE